MADKDQSPELSDRARPAGGQSAAEPRQAGLGNILVKSPRWKQKTLQRIEDLRSGDGTDREPDDQRTLTQRGEEIEQLQQAISELEAEKARLTAEHQQELAARKAELQQLQAAYDEFEQQSDLLLRELERQNERLRDECRRQNRRSVL